MSRLIRVLATWFGLGLAPILSGTFGTIGAIPLFWVLSQTKAPVYFGFTLLFTFFAVWVSEKAIPLFQSDKKPPNKPNDPSKIVIDEVAGFLWAGGIVRYLGFWNPQDGFLWLVLIPFLLFRLFDAFKIWPVCWAEEKWDGGFGVVIDDVVAGVMAGVVGILFCILFPLAIYPFFK